MVKTAEVEIIKQGENKYEVKVQGIKVAVFFEYENAIQYEKDLKELNPYVKFRNRYAKD